MNSYNEFEQFMRLIKDFQSGINVKSEIKSKDVKKVEEMRQQCLNQLYEKKL